MEVLNRHRHMAPISRGIFYCGNRNGEIVPITAQELQARHIIIDNFIIGISRAGLLRPIYDRYRRMVIVRLSDFNNTPLTAYEAQQMPYNYYWLPPSHSNGNEEEVYSSGSSSPSSSFSSSSPRSPFSLSRSSSPPSPSRPFSPSRSSSPSSPSR